MVKKFKSKGVKIDGVGVQAHWDLKSPSIDQIEQIILDVHAAGVPVSFTELDISVLPNPWEMVRGKAKWQTAHGKRDGIVRRTIWDRSSAKQILCQNIMSRAYNKNKQPQTCV